jgi:hypothetical protein
MKTLIIFCFATAAFLSFPACTTVEATHQPAVHRTTTTTTEQSSVHRPVSSTTETQTIRTY